MVISSSLVKALSISEIELNPAGEDSGHEWIELYHDGSLDLDSYFLVNGRGKIFNLSGSINGYQQVTFSGLWLVNSNASLFLIQGNTILQQVLLLADNANDDRTWNYCGNEWIFASGSPVEANTCSGNSPRGGQPPQHQQPPASQQTQQNDESDEDHGRSTVNHTTVNVPTVGARITNTSSRAKIVLGEVQTASETDNEETIVTAEGFIRDKAIYAFAAICLVVIIFLLLRKTDA